MNPYELVQTIGLIADHATTACKLIRNADLLHGQSGQPALATPQQPNPPTPDQLRAAALQQRRQADAEIALFIGLANSLVPKPIEEPSLKLAGRLAGLNVTPQELDGSTQ